MVLWKEWLALVVEKYWLEEELKEERKYLFHQKLDQKNNAFIILTIYRVLLLLVTPFFFISF